MKHKSTQHPTNTLPSVSLIHVGYPKAASTYLKRVFLAKITRNLVIPRASILKRIREGDMARHELLQSLTSLLRNDVDPVVLSNEVLTGSFFSGAGAHDTATNLQRYFPSAKIIIVVREQYSYIKSVYNFLIRSGHNLQPFSAFLRDHGPGLREKLQYHRLIGHYFDLFGPEHVKILPFELLKLDQEWFFSELSTFVDYPVKYDPLPGVQNQGLKRESLVELVRRTNRFMARYIRLEKHLKLLLFGRHSKLKSGWEMATAQSLVIKVLSIFAHNGSDLAVDPSFVENTRQCFSDSNRLTSELAGIDLKTLGYS